jgi:hypothetical protein
MCIAALRVNSVNDALQILRDYPELAKQLKGVDLALGGGGRLVGFLFVCCSSCRRCPSAVKVVFFGSVCFSERLALEEHEADNVSL